MTKFLIFFAVIALDQFTKQFALTGLLPAWGGKLINPICNPFISWGIPLTGSWFWLLWIFAIGSLFTFLLNSHYNISLMIILSGAISNLIDRVQLHCVIDFIKLGNFPVFNLADIAITLGMFFF